MRGGGKGRCGDISKSQNRIHVYVNILKAVEYVSLFDKREKERKKKLHIVKYLFESGKEGGDLSISLVKGVLFTDRRGEC